MTNAKPDFSTQIQNVLAGRSADGRDEGYASIFRPGTELDASVHAGIEAVLLLLAQCCEAPPGDEARTSLILRLIGHHIRGGYAPFTEDMLADLLVMAAWIARNPRHFTSNASIFKLLALARREQVTPVTEHGSGNSHQKPFTQEPIWASISGLFDCCEILNAAQLLEVDLACNTKTPNMYFFPEDNDDTDDGIPAAYLEYWGRRTEQHPHRFFTVREGGRPCALMIFRQNQLYQFCVRNGTPSFVPPSTDSLAAICKLIGDISITHEIYDDIGHLFMDVLCARIGLHSSEFLLLRMPFSVPEVAPAGLINPHPLQLRAESSKALAAAAAKKSTTHTTP